MKNTGKVFEEQIKKSIPDDAYYYRLKDSSSSFSHDGSSRFTPKNPFDCFVFYKQTLFTLELKTTNATSFSFERSKSDKGKKIHYHQIEALTDSSKFNDVISGFLLDFQDSETYFLEINNFNKFMEESDKLSINESNIIQYNGIKIEKEKKRVKHNYNILKLLDILIEERR